MVVPIQYQLKDDGQPLLLNGDSSSDLFGYLFLCNLFLGAYLGWRVSLPFSSSFKYSVMYIILYTLIGFN